MKNKFFILIFDIILSSMAFGQAHSTFKGKVFDSESKNPIPYATILFKNKHLGTYSDQNGLFSLSCLPNDTIYISSIGYESIFVVTRKFQDNDGSSTNDDSLFMKKATIVLNTITISAQRPTKMRVSQKWVGYAQSKKYGHYIAFRQLATWIPNSYKVRLKVIKVRCLIDNDRVNHFYENDKLVSKKIKNAKIVVRLSILSKNYMNNEPSDENLLKENIVLEVEENQEKIDFELGDQDFYMPSSGFFVCLEMLGIIKNNVFCSYEQLKKVDCSQFVIKSTNIENSTSFIKSKHNKWFTTQLHTFKFGAQLEIPE